MTIQETARDLRQLFEWKEFPNGRKCYAFTDAALSDAPKGKDALSSVIHEANTSEDFAYESVVRALDIIADNSENEEDARDNFSEEEPPVYTAELTAWLASDVRHHQTQRRLDTETASETDSRKPNHRSTSAPPITRGHQAASFLA